MPWVSCKDVSNFCFWSSDSCSCCLVLRSSWLRDAWQLVNTSCSLWIIGETSGKGNFTSLSVYACLCLYAHAEIYYIYACIYIYTIIARNFCSMLVSTTTSCQEVDRPDRIKQVDLSCRKLPPCCIDVRWCKMFHHVEPASRGMSFQLALKLRSLLLMQSWSLGPIMTHDCQDKICPSIPRVPTSYSPAGHFVGAFVSRSLTPCHGDWLASCASLNLHFAGGRTNH